MSAFSVIVEVTGQTDRKLTIQTSPSMTILALKRLIASSLRIQPENVRLSFSEVSLVDTQTVSSYNIRENNIVMMVYYEPNPKRVVISALSGASYPEFVHINDTAEMLLGRLAKTTGIKGMILVQESTPIEPTKRLWELGIEDGATFLLQLKLAGGKVAQ